MARLERVPLLGNVAVLHVHEPGTGSLRESREVLERNRLALAERAPVALLQAAPRDRDRGGRAELRAVCRHALRVGAQQLPRLAREARGLAAEEPRKRTQRHMEIAARERRLGFGGRDERDLRQACPVEAGETRIAFDHGLDAALAELRQERREQDLVADALLHPHRHAPRPVEALG